MSRLIVVICLLWFISDVAQSCLYESCPDFDPDTLNLHIVCHTHDDMGWLKTVDEYYYGGGRNPNVGVQFILDSVTAQLALNKERRFVYVETGFFSRWWAEQTEEWKRRVVEMVNSGQLEFVNGGWTMNDEAASHYVDTIEQMSFGMRKLNDTFGACGNPRVGWQVDPFGHSREQALLYGMMGFDSMFLGRIHYLDRKRRIQEKSLEMIWKTSDDIDDSRAQMFTGVFPGSPLTVGNYNTPPGFNFDSIDKAEIVRDDPNLPGYNVDHRAHELVRFAKMQAEMYRTNHIMFTFGDDFSYTTASIWFKNIDRLIKYINNHKSDFNLTAFYSTPTCYTAAKHDAGIDWPEKQGGDFFPYANNAESYWSGYYTSRPTLKGFVRQNSNLLQIAKVVSSITNRPENADRLEKMEASQSLLQHHDAITGTAKQYVNSDGYYRSLHESVMTAQDIFHDSILQTAESVQLCPLLNESICNPTENPKTDNVTVTVFNGASHARNMMIKIPIPETDYRTSWNVEKVVQANQPIFKTAQLHSTRSTRELLFEARVPALGYANFNLQRSRRFQKKEDNEPVTYSGFANHREIKLSNKYLTVSFDHIGRLSSLTNNQDGVTYNISQEFLLYESYSDRGQQSGAYIFRPDPGTEAHPILDGVVFVETTNTHLVQEVRQTFTSWITQVIRLYKDAKHLELEWTVGPIPSSEYLNGLEIISRYKTSIKTEDNSFYTDSNGRQLVERVRDLPSGGFQFNDSETISRNYYPVTAKILVQDDKNMIGVLTDRSQGGTADDGDIELMLHRRLTQDDGRGVGEALNEKDANDVPLVARGKHWLFAAPREQGVEMHRTLADELFHQPVVAFSPNRSSWTNDSALAHDLPRNVKILTLDRRGSDLLLRLEHTFQKSEHSELSKAVTVDLKSLFSKIRLVGIEELALGGDRMLEDAERLCWNSAACDSATTENDFTVKLEPMEIRTFKCKLEE